MLDALMFFNYKSFYFISNSIDMFLWKMNFKRLTRTERRQDRKKKRRKEKMMNMMNMIQKTSRRPTMNYDELGRGGGYPQSGPNFFKLIVY